MAKYIFSLIKYTKWCKKTFNESFSWAKGCSGNPIEDNLVYNSENQRIYFVPNDMLEFWCNKI